MTAAIAILLAAMSLGACWSWLRVRRYRRLLRTPAARDDRLVCRGEHRSFEVHLTPEGWALPHGFERTGGTVFLHLTIEASFLGRFIEPSLTATRSGARVRQYFEREARGRRYLDVSPLFAAGPADESTWVDLRGHGLTWRRGQAFLLFFPRPAIPAGDVLVLAPHPDDAEIAAYGLYARRPSWVVTVTAGDLGLPSLERVVPSHEATRWLTSLRVWDSLLVPRAGGIPPERCANLVFPDGKLEAMHRERSARFTVGSEPLLPRRELRHRNPHPDLRAADEACSWDDLIADLRRVLDLTRPSVVACPHPLLDSHPDHVFLAVALAQALRQGDNQAPLVLLYVVHVRDGSPLFPFGPRDGMAPPPPWAGEDWLADSVYSHPLDVQTQHEKYFAVEICHDLRSYPSGTAPTFRETLRRIREATAAWVTGLPVDPLAFTRRGPRPNEIYFVVGPGSLEELAARALAARGGPAT